MKSQPLVPSYFRLEPKPSTSAIMKSGHVMEELFQLTQPANTKIGCAFKKCTTANWSNVYCVLNSRPIKDGDVIYNVGTAGTCIDCPTGTGCDPTSNLCIPLSSLPPTSPEATTTPSTSATAPTTTTAAATTTTTTTPPTSPEAGFPSGASCRCSHPLASRMTDALRNEYERLHNFRWYFHHHA
ncbi:hypothetical protein Aduo_013852 [Ancylostoma duodenale]